MTIKGVCIMSSEWSRQLQGRVEAALDRFRQTRQASEQLRMDESELDRVYRDEPILFTAAQMSSYTPPKIQQMRQIARNFDRSLYNQSTAMIFYTQGQFMADFEDDFPEEVGFFQYFPTYQSMTNRQLRAYFTWRARVRSGWLEQTSLSFVHVYAFELLNQIGVDSAQAGYDALYRFWQAYRELDNRVDENLSRWLRDYVIWHDLPPALLSERALSASEQAILTLRSAGTHSAAEVCTAMSQLSSYRLENSRFFKLHSNEMAEVVRRVFLALDDYYDRHRKNGICEKLFGRVYTSPYDMFHAAVFYRQSAHPDTVYELSPLHRYHCRSGQWTREQFYFHRAKSAEAGALLKQIDYQMRQAYGFASTLKPAEISKTFQSVVDKVLTAYLSEQAAVPEPVVPAIDLSRLQDIRRAALQTQRRLIVEDLLPDGIATLPERLMYAAPAGEEAPEPIPAEEEDIGLAPAEYRLLQCLLYDRPWQDWVRAEGLMVSLLADAINERLFDRFDDTVLLCNGDSPVLIEDYIDELKGIIRP